jgi:hypothetical protein
MEKIDSPAPFGAPAAFGVTQPRNVQTQIEGETPASRDGNGAALITPSTPIPLSKLSKFIPPGRKGKRRHAATIYRYAQRGVRGIRLLTMQLPDGLYTTLAWWHEFVDQLTAALGRPQVGPQEQAPRANSQRQNTVEKEISEVRASLRSKNGGAQ